ncbi:hypothetical protein PF003_g7880 [Phytophthora fragariae]|nr:hypothetical protein PF003_g7880 [Phytophthora fragariae]
MTGSDDEDLETRRQSATETTDQPRKYKRLKRAAFLRRQKHQASGMKS